MHKKWRKKMRESSLTNAFLTPFLYTATLYIRKLPDRVASEWCMALKITIVFPRTLVSYQDS